MFAITDAGIKLPPKIFHCQLKVAASTKIRWVYFFIIVDLFLFSFSFWREKKEKQANTVPECSCHVLMWEDNKLPPIFIFFLQVITSTAFPSSLYYFSYDLFSTFPCKSSVTLNYLCNQKIKSRPNVSNPTCLTRRTFLQRPFDLRGHYSWSGQSFGKANLCGNWLKHWRMKQLMTSKMPEIKAVKSGGWVDGCRASPLWLLALWWRLMSCMTARRNNTALADYGVQSRSQSGVATCFQCTKWKIKCIDVIF